MVWAYDEARGNKSNEVVIKINIEGKRRKERPKKRRLDTIENDMRLLVYE
jgi:hypothetical protein